MTRDVDLLQLETETIWRPDGQGRLSGPHHLVIGAAADGQMAAVGAAVPEPLATELRHTVAGTPTPAAPGRPPPALRRCQQLLSETLGPVEVSAGPSYLVPAGVSFDSGATVVRSDSTGSAALREANPGNWQADEWTDLLDGKLGPWAMATHGDAVIAICHTSARSDHAAEAGTWTHPDFRGRGHAAATTAAWTSLFANRRQRLFYSTSAANRSSQRVAARLGLRLIGWLWKVSPAGTAS